MGIFMDDFNPMTPPDYELEDGTKYWFTKNLAIVKFNGFDMFTSMGEINSKSWESVAILKWSTTLQQLMWRMPFARKELRGWNLEQAEVIEAYKLFLGRIIFK